MHTIKCVQCGATFESGSRLTKTCSDPCRKARKRDQNIICKSGRSRTGTIETCRYCGKRYEVTSASQAYCSQRCRKNAENRLKRAAARTVPATCVICGKGFMTSKNAKGKTCSPECLTRFKSALTTEREAKKKAERLDIGEYNFRCPFSIGAMKSGISEYPDYGCAQIDPFGRYEDFQPAQPKGEAQERMAA